MCGVCNVSIRQALKVRGNGEPYQLRRLKSKRVCCVPSCSSTDIEVYRHDFSWGDVCNSIDKMSLPQLTVYYVQSITSKCIECSM